MTGETTITITLLLAIVGCIISVVNFFDGKRKNHKAEARSEAIEMTTMIVKMENVRDDIRELKNDMQQNMKEIKIDISSIKADMNQFREKLAKVEQSTASAHKRLDQMEILRAHETKKD